MLDTTQGELRRAPRPSPSPSAIVAGATLDALAALLDAAAARQPVAHPGAPSRADADAALLDAVATLAAALAGEGECVSLEISTLATSPAGGAAGGRLDALAHSPARVTPALPLSLSLLTAAALDSSPEVYLVEAEESGPVGVMLELGAPARAPGEEGGTVELSLSLAVEIRDASGELLDSAPLVEAPRATRLGGDGPARLQPAICDAADASGEGSPLSELGWRLRRVADKLAAGGDAA